MGKWVLHTNLARADTCPPSRSGYCTRNRNTGPYHAIRRITLSAGSRYPRDHAICSSRNVREGPARQSERDDGALPLFLLSCPGMPASQGTVDNYSYARSCSDTPRDASLDCGPERQTVVIPILLGTPARTLRDVQALHTRDSSESPIGSCYLLAIHSHKRKQQS